MQSYLHYHIHVWWAGLGEGRRGGLSALHGLEGVGLGREEGGPGKEEGVGLGEGRRGVAGEGRRGVAGP